MNDADTKAAALKMQPEQHGAAVSPTGLDTRQHPLVRKQSWLRSKCVDEILTVNVTWTNFTQARRSQIFVELEQLLFNIDIVVETSENTHLSPRRNQHKGSSWAAEL